MRYTVIKSQIDVLGIIWVPAVECAHTYTLNDRDLKNIGEWTRENVGRWLVTNSGDFQSITDFRADFSQGNADRIIDWKNEESEATFVDLTFPMEE